MKRMSTNKYIFLDMFGKNSINDLFSLAKLI